jgi:DNA primase catalytic core
MGLDDDQIDGLDAGEQLKMPCPAHDGEHEKLYVKVGDNSELLFKCFSGGCSYEEIVAAIRGGEAIEYKPRLRVVKDAPKQRSLEAQRALESVLDSWTKRLQELDELHPAWKLLAERGITREQAKELQLGYGGIRSVVEVDFELGLAVKNPPGSVYRSFQPYRHRLTVPLYDPEGVLIGFAGRALDGDDRKWVNPSSEQYDKSSYLYGESIARELLEDSPTLVICEGFWDQIACTRVGIASVAIGGTSLTEQQISRIAEINPGLVVWVADGDGPGRTAAAKGAARLAKTGLSVVAISSPDGQDPADWPGLAAAVDAATPSTVSDLINLAMLGVDLDDEKAKKSTSNVVKQILKDWPDQEDATQAMTTQLAHTLGLPVGKLREGVVAKPEKGEKESASVKMLGLAASMYEIHCDNSSDSEELWIARAGSHVVRVFSESNNKVNRCLLAEYFDTYGEAPPRRIAGDVLSYLAGRSYDGEPIEVSQRIAEAEDIKYVDLGRRDEQVLIIEAGKPPVVGNPPKGVYFSRRGKYGELPIPEKTPGVTVDTLWDHIRVAEADRPIVLAWLFAAWSPSLQTPILLLEGAQGAAKSTSTRRLLSLLDPVPRGDSGLKSPPKDNSELIISLGASRVVAIDNLSYLGEMQNTLCQAATGGEAEGRKLYSNDEVFTINLKSAVILTGLDLGVLHGDLASRVAGITLDPVPRSISIPDDLLEKQWAKVHPGLVWEIAELVSKIMAVMPTVTLKESPRMASFGRILAAVDQIMGTDGLSTYMLAEGERQKDVALTDPVATEIIHWMTDGSNWLGGRKPEWSGSSTELLNELNSRAAWKEGREPKGWPSSANALGMRVTKLKIPMATEGIDIDKGRGSSARIITIRLLNVDATPPVVDDEEEEDVTPAPRKARPAKPVEEEEDEYTF